MVKRGCRVNACTGRIVAVLFSFEEAIAPVWLDRQRPGAPMEIQSRVYRRFPRPRVWWVLRRRCGGDRPLNGRIRGRCNRCPKVGCWALQSMSRSCSWGPVQHNRGVRRCIRYTKCTYSPGRVRWAVTAKMGYNLAKEGRRWLGKCRFSASQSCGWNRRISASWFPRCGTAR
jgi:hypothetical protein